MYIDIVCLDKKLSQYDYNSYIDTLVYVISVNASILW